MGGMGGNQRKGFKVTDAERKVRVGIAVESIDELRAKTISKFKLAETHTAAADICFQTRDGRPIRSDAEFGALPAQTLLIWLRRGERAETDAEILYRTIREVNFDFLRTGEAVHEFFTEQMKNKVYGLAKVLKELDDDKAKASTKEADPDWFQGVESRAKTKEEYMFRRAQDRIKRYYYATKDELRANRRLADGRVHEVCERLAAALKDAAHFGRYFDRRCAPAAGGGGALCDATGRFQCQGRWDCGDCGVGARHAINPYRSYEERIIFQTWNLDHRVERSRAILPAIAHAIEHCDDDEPNAKRARRSNGGRKRASRVDCDRIFDDLFTTKNLKLVHIVCHDKAAHIAPDLMRYVIE